MRNRFTIICLAFALSFTVSSCVKKKKDDFDRTALLTNIGNSVAIPALEQFALAANLLKQQSDAFTSAPDAARLDSLQAAYQAAYVALMGVEVYDFSGTQDFRNSLNSFPCDTNQILNNISSGVYDFNTVNNLRAKGFPALDFLLYSKNATETLQWFTTSTNAVNARKYISDIVNELQVKAQSSVNTWKSTYVNTFINANGIDIGSSVSLLVNDLSLTTERCRRERVGNSLGYVGFISNGQISPLALEATYSRFSKELLVAHLQQMKELYRGKSGMGFDDYLEQIGAEYDGAPLSTTILNQFDVCISAAQNVTVDFNTALSTQKPAMENLFLELKKLVVLVKVDMSSQLGVVISYSDNDGD